MSHNYISIINIPGLEQYLQETLDFIPGSTMFPTLFGDEIFVPSPVIINRILNSDLRQEIIDKRMPEITHTRRAGDPWEKGRGGI